MADDLEEKRGFDISKLADMPEPTEEERQRYEAEAKEAMDVIRGMGGFDVLAQHRDEAAKAAEAMRESLIGTGVLEAWKDHHADLAKSLQGALPDMARMSDALNPMRAAMEEASASMEGITGALAGMAVPDHLKDIDTGLAGALKGLDLPDYLKDRESSLAQALAGIDGAGIHDRMKGLAGVLGEDSSLAKVAMDIDRQQSLIDRLGLDAHSHIPEPIHFPEIKNPIVETNDRLARIEERFDMAFDLAKDSAQVANGLQASAAEFLHKFQVEADKNNESVNKTISVARWSLLAVVVFACAQIAAPFFIPDREAEALRGTVTELRSEVEALRESQAETSERLIEALAASDAETAAALRAIAEQLAQPVQEGGGDE